MTGTQDRGERGRFLTGNNGGPGRPRGSRNRLSQSFIEAYYEDFKQHGVGVIERVRQEDPVAYLKTGVVFVPKQQERVVSPLEGMSDEHLLDTIDSLHETNAELRSIIAQLEGAAGSKRAGARKAQA